MLLKETMRKAAVAVAVVVVTVCISLSFLFLLITTGNGNTQARGLIGGVILGGVVWLMASVWNRLAKNGDRQSAL